jgi:hypothetical protein
MASDALTISDSTNVLSTAKSDSSLFSFELMKDFPKIQVAANDTPLVPPLELHESSDPQTRLDDWSKELTAVLNADTSIEDASPAFEQFMKEHGTQMYWTATELTEYDGTNTMCDSMNKALEGTGFATNMYDRSGTSIELSKDDQFVVVVDVGPSFDEMMKGQSE